MKPFLAVQRYCSQPLLVNGRKFGLRVWAAVTSSDPLRVYLHSTGLVLFSSQVGRGSLRCLAAWTACACSSEPLRAHLQSTGLSKAPF